MTLTSENLPSTTSVTSHSHADNPWPKTTICSRELGLKALWPWISPWPCSIGLVDITRVVFVGGQAVHSLHKVADPTKCEPKSALGVDYNHHCWHEDPLTLSCAWSKLWTTLLTFDRYNRENHWLYKQHIIMLALSYIRPLCARGEPPDHQHIPPSWC